MIDVTRLKDIRENQDLSQEEMAQILKVKRSTYSLWELGISIIPFNHLYNYASFFHLTIDYVLGLSNDRTKVNYSPFDLKAIGNNLKNYRIQNSLLQREVANKLKISQACITRYEKGLICISTQNIYKYSLLFKTSIYSLCEKKIRI